jgi:hypothetical protein
VNVVRTNTGLAKLYVKFRDAEKAADYLSKAEKLAESRNSYKELSKICKIYSESFEHLGKTEDSRRFLEKHYEYLKKLLNIEEENKLQAMMLGHIPLNGDNSLLTRYFTDAKREETVSAL